MRTTFNNRIVHIEVPERMRSFKLSSEGYPVPWFVPWCKDPDGQSYPEFRGFDPEKLSIAVRLKRCWLCGEPLGKFMTFVIGPMCAVNRISAEPPSHHSCGEYAVKACPFLTQPRMRRNEKDLPPSREGAGIMLRRNPGVTLLWTTLDYRLMRDRGGVLFRVGQPEKLEWFAEGRVATRPEILDSIESGLPVLREIAQKEGAESITALDRMIDTAMKLVPAA